MQGVARQQITSIKSTNKQEEEREREDILDIIKNERDAIEDGIRERDEESEKREWEISKTECVKR